MNPNPSVDERTPRMVHSTAYEKSHVIADRGATLFGIMGYNSGAAQFIQIHDAAAVPSSGTGVVPAIVFTVAATSNFSLAATLKGMHFPNGIVVVNSSTGPTYTAGADDCFFTASIH